jgi:hypothetical protein
MTEQGNYKINYEPLFGPLQLIDVREAIEQADHPWYNQTLIEVGGVLLRLGVFAGGEYHWPSTRSKTNSSMSSTAGCASNSRVATQWSWLPGWHSRFRAGCGTARWRWSLHRC